MLGVGVGVVVVMVRRRGRKTATGDESAPDKPLPKRVHAPTPRARPQTNPHTNNKQHIAVTINEEVGLHTRLLEQLDEDVDATHLRLRAATKRVRHVLRHGSNWRGGCFIFVLIVVLTLVVLVAFKIIRLFGF